LGKNNKKLLEKYDEMPYDLAVKKENEIRKNRMEIVRKSNDLIQRFRAEMNTPQFKITLYLISKAYTYENTLDYTFDIQDFCKCCGLDFDNGNNYIRLKRELKKLADKSQWVEVFGDPDVEVLVRLVSKYWIYKRSGKIKIRLDEDIKPYILQLRENWENNSTPYTQFALLYTLPMRSLYSIRLYELLKSWEHSSPAYDDGHWWSISDLQQLLNSNYDRYQDFRRKVIEIALREINEYSDITVSYEPIKEGRSYKYIQFYIKSKSEKQLIEIKQHNHDTLDGLQMSFDDFLDKGENQNE
jgi:plasmid replication initiation protein